MTCPTCSDALMLANENAETATCPCGWAGYLEALIPPKPSIDEMWNQWGYLVDHTASRWTQRCTGADPYGAGGAYDACMDGFLNAYNKWDPSKAAFNTFLTRGLWQRLRAWSQREMRRAGFQIQFESLDELKEIENTINMVTDIHRDFKSYFSTSVMGLGPLTQGIVSEILSRPEKWSVKYPLRQLYKVFMAQGWSRRAIRESVIDLRKVLSSEAVV